MHSPTSAKKVGIFFIVGMVILGAVTFRAEHLGRLFKKHNTYNAYFQSSKGVKKGARVTLSWMDIGTVKKVVVEGDRLLIAMAIEKKIPIRDGSVATIIPDFLFGKSYVDLNLVPPTLPVLPSGSTIKGVDIPGLSDIWGVVFFWGCFGVAKHPSPPPRGFPHQEPPKRGENPPPVEGRGPKKHAPPMSL